MADQATPTRISDSFHLTIPMTTNKKISPQTKEQKAIQINIYYYRLPVSTQIFILHNYYYNYLTQVSELVMDKLKLAQLGVRLKTGGAQMGRLVTEKVKEILQTPTPESKLVDEATSDTINMEAEGPNWGLNLRICKMINAEEISGTEIVRAIRKKISGTGKTQRLSLDLLETCAMNCEKVFSEVASEKVLDEMVKMIDNPQTHQGNKKKGMDLIRAWGESEDLAYLPVFRQTYMVSPLNSCLLMFCGSLSLSLFCKVYISLGIRYEDQDTN